MKSILIIILLNLLISCSNDDHEANKNTNHENADHKSIQNETTAKSTTYKFSDEKLWKEWENMNVYKTPVKHFPSIEIMVNVFNDYSTEQGTFEVISVNPLHVQISPLISVQHDFPEIKNAIISRSIVYIVYHSFAFTKTNKFTVTILPKDFQVKNRVPVYTPVLKLEKTFTITRQQALEIVQKYVKVSSISELFITKSDKLHLLYQWTEPFKTNIYSNDPELIKFVNTNF